ncbi:MAG: molecular chaperone DnaJ [Planctomycetales bacterium]
MPTKRDFYEVLGVSREASADEIKKAYRKMAMQFHPDRNRGDADAAERFKECAEAYEILSDDEKKSRYDRYGHAGLGGAAGGGAGFRDVSDIFEAFSDIFGGAFGGGGRTRGRGGRRGESLRTQISIDLLEAAKGTKRVLEIERPEVCKTCSGSGAKPGSSPETCGYCGGRGQVVQSQGFFRVQTTCPGCHGEGHVVRDKCTTCHGSGRQEKSVTLEVTIPPGVDNGMQLCLRGEGEPGYNGGPAGDLYCDLHVKEHPFFQREGNHLICNLPITYTQAALGTEVEIPLLEGREKLTIPPGTQPQETFRLRKQGMPDAHGRGRGDLLVHIQVEVPKKLNARQRELLEELSELEHVNVSPHRKTFFEKLKDYFSADDNGAD